MKILIAVLGALCLIAAVPLTKDKVVVAIDCGAVVPYKSSEAIVFTANPFDGIFEMKIAQKQNNQKRNIKQRMGKKKYELNQNNLNRASDNLYTQNTKVADYTYNQSIMKKTIKYTDDQQLYKTERHSDENFAYSLPVKEFGTYTVILKFCELYFTDPGKRVFSILFGDTVVVPEVDIVKEVGPFAAYDLYIEFELKSDLVFYHKGKPCENALDTAHQGLIIEFAKIGKDLPKVDAIVLMKGGIAESNYEEYQTLIRNWSEEGTLISEDEQFQKLENLRKKIKDEFDTSIDYDAYNKTRFEGILDILFSWKGLLILITLIIFQFCLFCSEDPHEAQIDRQRRYSEEIQSPEKKESANKNESKKKK